jgi:hypothetical protein
MQDRGYGGYGFLRRRLLGNRVNKEQPLPEVPTARGLGSRPPAAPKRWRTSSAKKSAYSRTATISAISNWLWAIGRPPTSEIAQVASPYSSTGASSTRKKPRSLQREVRL